MATNLITNTGNRVQVMFGSTRVGLLQDARFSEDYGLQPATDIGSAIAAEYVPGMARYSISFSKMTLINETMRALGISPENSITVLQGLVFDIAVFSKDTGAMLRTYVSASYGSGDISIGANRIIMTNGTYMALDVRGTGI